MRLQDSLCLASLMQSCSTLSEKERVLRETLERSGGLIVAYSGGVDSSLLAYYARQVLGERAKIVIAVSPSLAEEELSAARAQATHFHWDLIEIATSEVEKEEYRRNDALRCYFCKSTLFEELDKLAAEMNIAKVAYGANVSDLGDYRPGHRAAREHQVLSPLQTAQLAKDEIRELAKQAGLPSWDRPQAACLSSRFPTFEPVSVTLLTKVDKAEQVLHRLGFGQVRVRHHTLKGKPGVENNAGTDAETPLLARIEIDAKELGRFAEEPELFERVNEELKALGYSFVTLDLGGYRQGSGNLAAIAQSAKLDG